MDPLTKIRKMKKDKRNKFIVERYKGLRSKGMKVFDALDIVQKEMIERNYKPMELDSIYNVIRANS